MNRKFSFNKILHNDRLILMISLVLAIVVWATVVYGPSNEQERTISGVPVTVSLGEYATDTLHMQLLDSNQFTASVRVYGRRSVVEQLSAQDILLTVDTSSIVAPGTYSGLSIKATKNGKQTDFEILSVEPGVTSLTCDVWTEATFAVQADIRGVTSADETKYQLGTPVVSGDVMQNSTVTVTGPKTEVDSIVSIFAVTDETQALTATKVFDATLKAVDVNGNAVDISHCTLSGGNAAVKITVPVLLYKRVELQYTLLNTPTAYESMQNVVTFTPSYLELWGDEQTISSFEAQLKKLCTFDFDSLTKEKLQQDIALNVPETLKILGGVQTVTAKFNLKSITSKTINLDLNDSNVKVLNSPADVAVQPVEMVLSGITLYGPANVLNRIRAADLLVTMDVNNEIAQGQRALTTRVLVPNYPNVWVYYGEDTAGYKLLATVTKK